MAGLVRGFPNIAVLPDRPPKRHAHRRASARPVQLKLDPCLPDGGVSATVKDGKDNDPPRFRNEVDAEGEAIGCDPSNVLSNHCIELWMLRGQSNAAINFGGELNAEAYPLCLVTRCCLIKL